MKAYENVRIFIQTLERTIDTFSIPLLCLGDKPSLEDVRKLLEHSPLGAVEKDIFFPSWTKSLHIVVELQDASSDEVPSWDAIEEAKITVDTAEKLHEVLDKEEKTPGTAAIILQQCRSKRYSRKKDPALPAATANNAPGFARRINISPVSSQASASSRSSSPPRSPRPALKKKEPTHYKGSKSQFIHPGVGAAHPREAYRPITYDSMYFEPPCVPITIVAPPSVYPQCYTIPLGFPAHPIPPCGFLPGMPIVPPVVPAYYGYGPM